MYTENDLSNLLKQVEAEFAPFLAKMEAETLLAKSEESDDKKPKDKEDKAPPADGPPAEAKASVEGEKAEGEAEEADGKAKEAAAEGEKAAADGVPPAEGAEGAAPPAADAAACPPGDPNCDYDDEDHAHMADMYGSMSPGELKAHHDAVRRALDAQGGGQPAAPAAPMAAEGAVPPPTEMDKCGPGMMKSEKTVEVPVESLVSSAELQLAKTEITAQKAELEDLKKSNDVMKQFISKLFDKKKAPAGKAITDLGVLEKSDGTGKNEVVLSKNEITKILTAKANNPTLAKSDRNAISSYYTGGQVNLDSIRHLLK